MADFIASEIIKQFDTASGPLKILNGVSLEMNRGDQLAILGESGSGKSTFLHIAGTLDSADSGSITLMDQVVTDLLQSQLPAFRNEKVGFVFQQHHLLPQLSALENVLVPVLAKGDASETKIERAKELLDAVGLGDRTDHRPALLSGGECQRVAVARALINDPLLLLADEPTGSLDETTARSIGELLLKMQKQNNSILICVTHSLSLAAQFDQQMRLTHGQLHPSNSASV